MEDHEPWHITVVRANGLRLMRPEKSWRPIITLDIDKLPSHETILGTDGQNPNLKEVIQLHRVRSESQVDIKVWHRPQSKKKTKKRILVAYASHSLKELLKRYESGQKIIEVRLQCQNVNSRSVAARGRPQSGAVLLLKVRPPQITLPPQLPEEEHADSEHESDSLSSDEEPGTLTPSPPTPRPGSPKPHVRIRGYLVDSEEESEGELFTEDEKQSLIRHRHPQRHIDDIDDDDNRLELDIYNNDKGYHQSIAIISIPQRIFSSILPQYTEQLVLPPELMGWRRILASFTLYGELQGACTRTQFEACHKRLQSEWQYSGAILLALTGVDVAILAISTDAIFPVSENAKRAASASVMASVLGLFYTVFFFLRYNWIDVDTFSQRAKDVYGSYASFALSARIPGICMLISVLSLLTFVFFVAYDAWAQGVLALCFFVGVITTLQFLIYSTHWLAGKVAAGSRASTRSVMNAVTRLRTASTGSGRTGEGQRTGG
ncbi:hypothetical protein AX16_004842 [Volvariella volvacea WC 439]|nr:hypothetical protein AX16_004842 [Volvariella volvacea WC 439]